MRTRRSSRPKHGSSALAALKERLMRTSRSQGHHGGCSRNARSTLRRLPGSLFESADQRPTSRSARDPPATHLGSARDAPRDPPRDPPASRKYCFATE